MSNSLNLPIERICRVCLNENENMMNIFTENISDKLQDLAKVEIQENDNLPKLVCNFCANEINKWFDFKIQIIQNDATLRYIKTENWTSSDLNLEPPEEVMIKEEVPDDPSDSSQTFECDICKKVVTTSHSLERHKRIHTGEKPYPCEDCPEAFATQNYLTIHVNKSHTGEKPFHCDICNKFFSSNGYLKVHKQFHKGEKPFSCPDCDNSFTTKNQLTSHIRYKHTFERPFVCTECGMGYTTKVRLRHHMRRHTGEKPSSKHSCTICEKNFWTAADLRTHMRSHTDERPYQCDFCEKKLKTASHLAAHRRIHTGEKKHCCTYCDKAFRESAALKRHILSHTGEKPFSCELCEMSFTRRNNLKAHMKTHIAKICKEELQESN